MNAAMNEKGGRFNATVAVELIAMSVDSYNIGRNDISPINALRVDKKGILPSGPSHSQTEVIADSLVETKESSHS
jgi:hypothetical protein